MKDKKYSLTQEQLLHSNDIGISPFTIWKWKSPFKSYSGHKNELHYLPYRTGNCSTDHHLIEFTSKIPDLVKTQLAYSNWVDLRCYILIETNWRTNFSDSVVDLKFYFLAPRVKKIWKARSRKIQRVNLRVNH